MSELLTPRLRLRAFTPTDYEAALLGDTHLAAHLGAPVAIDWIEAGGDAIAWWLTRVRADPTVVKWALYGYFDRVTGELLGGGGFKGHPNEEGAVEAGYGLAPTARGQGYATEALQALVRFAFTQPQVRQVFAHTLPEQTPSTRVLRRTGFQFTGEVDDPEDGRLWRWELNR